MDYQEIFNTIQDEIAKKKSTGKVASYIPELAKVNPDKFGMHLYCTDSRHFGIGDDDERFSIQSISKVFALTLAMTLKEDKELFKRVDVEPSGDPFNSLVQLEFEKGIPRNPFINAGALVVSDILVSLLKNPAEDFLQLIRFISDNPSIAINQDVFESEMEHSHRNASLLHLMKSFGNIDNDVDKVLEFYTQQCAIEMSSRELTSSFMIYANRGKDLKGKQFISESQTKRVNAIMQTCGFYDEAGEFSFRVGLPGKSGVGGGIAAVHPGHYAVTVWSPPLNPKGNSELGMYALERLTSLTGFSIF